MECGRSERVLPPPQFLLDYSIEYDRSISHEDYQATTFERVKN